MKTVFSILAAAGLLLWPFAPARAGAGANYQPLEMNQVSDPKFPPWLRAIGCVEGQAAILITVDASGKLTDTLAISSTLPDFAEAAQAALREWTYQPARLNGQPVGVTKEVDFDFEQVGAVITANGGGGSEFFFRRFFHEKPAYRAFNLQEIDGKLAMKRVVQPPYTTELAARDGGGTVTLSYYIDEGGRVRMPVVLNDANPELADLATEAVRQWQFAPPTRLGKPVLVRVLQDFRFNVPSHS
jgi:TonB family protein